MSDQFIPDGSGRAKRVEIPDDIEYEGEGVVEAFSADEPSETRPEPETPLASGAAVEPAEGDGGDDAPFVFPSDGGDPSPGDAASDAPSDADATASEEAGNGGDDGFAG